MNCNEVTNLRAPDVGVRIVQPSPRIVRRGLDLRWRRLAHWNVSDQPHVIPRVERRGDSVAYWLRGIFQDHLRLKQIVTMEPMIRERRDCGPRCRTRILTIERNGKRPWMNDDEVVRTGTLAQEVGNELHVSLSIADKFMCTWQAKQGKNRKCTPPTV